MDFNTKYLKYKTKYLKYKTKYINLYGGVYEELYKYILGALKFIIMRVQQEIICKMHNLFKENMYLTGDVMHHYYDMTNIDASYTNIIFNIKSEDNDTITKIISGVVDDIIKSQSVNNTIFNTLKNNIYFCDDIELVIDTLDKIKKFALQIKVSPEQIFKINLFSVNYNNTIDVIPLFSESFPVIKFEYVLFEYIANIANTSIIKEETVTIESIEKIEKLLSDEKLIFISKDAFNDIDTEFTSNITKYLPNTYSIKNISLISDIVKKLYPIFREKYIEKQKVFNAEILQKKEREDDFTYDEIFLNMPQSLTHIYPPITMLLNDDIRYVYQLVYQYEGIQAHIDIILNLLSEIIITKNAEEKTKYFENLQKNAKKLLSFIDPILMKEKIHKYSNIIKLLNRISTINNEDTLNTEEISKLILYLKTFLDDGRIIYNNTQLNYGYDVHDNPIRDYTVSIYGEMKRYLSLRNILESDSTKKCADIKKVDIENILKEIKKLESHNIHTQIYELENTMNTIRKNSEYNEFLKKIYINNDEYFKVYSMQQPIYYDINDSNEKLTQLITEYKQGSIIYNQCFMSTAFNLLTITKFGKSKICNYLERYCYVINIKKDNPRWIYIGRASEKADENEVLIKCKSYFIMRSIKVIQLLNYKRITMIELDLCIDINDAKQKATEKL
jgi:hypothetical protein